MNIFWLHIIPEEQAKMYCDAHVVKIILEITQMLYTAWRVIYNGELCDGLLKEIQDTYKPMGYRATHKNHTMTKWVLTDYGYSKASDLGIA